MLLLQFQQNQKHFEIFVFVIIMSLNIIFFPLLYWLLQIPAAPTQFSQGGFKV